MSSYPPKRENSKNHNLKIALKLCKEKNISVLYKYQNIPNAGHSELIIPHPRFHSPDRSLLIGHPPTGLENRYETHWKKYL